MLNWLKRLFIGCEHKWKKESEYEVSGVANGHPVKNVYVLQCEKCGAMKNHVVSVFS